MYVLFRQQARVFLLFLKKKNKNYYVNMVEQKQQKQQKREGELFTDFDNNSSVP